MSSPAPRTGTGGPSTAKAQVGRLLALLPYLLAHPNARMADVARLFGVSEKQLRSDLDVLWYCGLPGLMPGDLIEVDMEALDGEGRINVTNADYLTRPLRLAADESVALLVALRALEESIEGEQRESVTRLAARLEAAAGDAAAVAGQVELQPAGPAVDPAIRDTVRTALTQRRRVHLRYWVPSRDETTERDVDPVRWVEAQGVAYLEGWCHRVEAIRLFRLDRIAAIHLLAEPAGDHPAPTRDPAAGSVFTPSANDIDVVLELESQAAWVPEYYPVEEVEELGDGRLRVRLRVTEPDWLVRLALRLGDAVHVVSPPDLTADVAAAARAALVAYER
jgi:proteasome accessory factor C